METGTESVTGLLSNQNLSLVREFSGFLKNKSDKKLHEDLLSDLKAMTDNYDTRMRFLSIGT